MRRFARVLLVVLFVLIAVWFPLLAPTPHRIDETHFELIQNGMTKAEVEGIFGVPAGQYDWAEMDQAIWFDLIGTRNNRGYRWASYVVVSGDFSDTVNWLASGHSWVSRHGACTVYFDDRGRVAFKSGWSSVSIEPPWKRWWGLIWKK